MISLLLSGTGCDSGEDDKDGRGGEGRAVRADSLGEGGDCVASGCLVIMFFFFQAEDGIRDYKVTGVQTCALPIWLRFSAISAGNSDHSCGITANNAAYCWGGNFYGQLGNETTTGQAVANPTPGDRKSVV